MSWLVESLHLSRNFGTRCSMLAADSAGGEPREAVVATTPGLRMVVSFQIRGSNQWPVSRSRPSWS